MADNTAPRPSTSGVQTKRKANPQTSVTGKNKVTRTSRAEDKQADRRHKALERQFAKAHQGTSESPSIVTSPLHSTAEDRRDTPAWSPLRAAIQDPPTDYDRAHLSFFDSGVRPQTHDSAPAAPASVSGMSQERSRDNIPSATFTPTAAGLRELDQPSFTAQLQAMVTQAVAQAMAAAGKTPPSRERPVSPTGADSPRRGFAASDQGSPPQSEGSVVSEDSVQLPDEGLWSDGEDIRTETSPTVGMFNPNSFYSLLQRACITGRIEPEKTQTAQVPGQSSHPIFAAPVTTNLQIPCPPIFLQSIQEQWGSPGAFSALGGIDRKLLDTVPSLNEVLEVPAVDEALAPILSDTKIPGDMSEALKAEDKKSEISLRRTHQASAWAIRASTSNSFFARIALIWLKELQDRISPEEMRVHQDVTKIRAALEYMADVSLQSAKYSARAIASNVAARRLFWLRNWKADTKHKWRVAAAPYTKGQLFGESLSSYLTENKDKKKVLAHVTKKSGKRFVPFNRRQSFRGGSDRPSWSGYRPFQSGPDRSSDRSGYRDKTGPQFQPKRSFRGRGGRPFRKSK